MLLKEFSEHFDNVNDREMSPFPKENELISAEMKVVAVAEADDMLRNVVYIFRFCAIIKTLYKDYF